MSFLTTVYCLFMFQCFDHGPVTELNAKDANGNFLPCPQECKCYRAPIKGFSNDMSSNSMICDGLPGDVFNQYFSSQQPDRPNIVWNTIVLKNWPQDKQITAKYILNAESVVLENISWGNGLSFLGSYHYLTFYQTDYLIFPEMISQDLLGIYMLQIEKDVNDDEQSLSPFQKFLGDTTQFSKLQSFTIRESGFDSINEYTSEFFPDSPLKTLDLSNNRFVNVDSICGYDSQSMIHNVHLERLYLNSNRLTAIPRGLNEAFPNLKILHLFGNPIKVFDFHDVEPLLNINEFLLFSYDEKLNGRQRIFNYNGIGNLKEKIKSKTQLPIGFIDSLMGLDVFCQNEPQIKALNDKEFSSTCPEWKHHPIRLYAQNDKLCRANDNQKPLDIRGQLIDFKKDSIDTMGPVSILSSNTVWLGLDHQAYESNYYIFYKVFTRNQLSVLRRMERYAIVRFDDFSRVVLDTNKKQNFFDFLEAVIDRPNVIGFEVADVFNGNIEFHSQTDVTNKNGCPLKFSSSKPIRGFIPTIRAYEEFVSACESKRTSFQKEDASAFIYSIAIDIREIEYAKVLLTDDNMKKCTGGDIRIDAVTIYGIDGNDGKHSKALADFRKSFPKLLFRQLAKAEENQAEILMVPKI